MLKKIHKIIGLSVALIVLHLSATGIILMYPVTLKLQETFLSNNYILSLYDMKRTTDVRVHKYHSNIGVISRNVIIDDYVIDTGLESILSLVKEKNIIFIASDKSLVIVQYDEDEPKVIKKIDLPFVLKGMFIKSKLGVNFVDEKNVTFYLDETHKFISIESHKEPLEEVLLVNADKESADLYLKFIQGPGVHLLRCITDIHNGRFFGKIVMILFSISSLGVIFLAISGTLMSLNITLKRSAYNKRKHRRHN